MKTNAVRHLESLGIPYELRDYEVDPDDLAAESVTFEITGTTDKIDGLVDVMRPYGVLEMVRTGLVAMTRGDSPLATTTDTADENRAA